MMEISLKLGMEVITNCKQEERSRSWLLYKGSRAEMLNKGSRAETSWFLDLGDQGHSADIK